MNTSQMSALSYMPTEVGNAQRLHDESDGDLRYHPGRGWLAWSGTHWVENEYVARQWATRSARSYLLAAVQGGNLEQRKWGMESERERVLKATLNLLQHLPGILVTEEDLDTDPWLLNCRTGTIDLRTGIEREHRREDYITMCAPASYQTDADYREWTDLLEKCHPGTGVAEYLQLVIGYGITGLVQEQMFVIHIGSGANGKGTFMHGLTETFGDYIRTARVAAFLKSRTETGSEAPSPGMMAMAGRRMIFAEEPDVSAKLDEGKLKNITGQGRISARKLQKDETEFMPKFLLQLLTNHLPTVWGRDEGIWRRIKVVEWTQDFSEGRDLSLYSRVSAMRDQILTWAVHGSAMYYQISLASELKLHEPEVVKYANAAYRKDNDRLDGWFPGIWTKDDNHFTPRAVLANDYAEWVRAEHGEEARPMSSTFLYKALLAAGVKPDTKKNQRGFYLRDTR